MKTLTERQLEMKKRHRRRHSNTSLTAADEARVLAWRNTHSLEQTAAKFHVSRSTISNIVRRMINRDTISIREFKLKTRQGFQKISEHYGLTDMADTGLPEHWAAYMAILRHVPDDALFFPSGKWATIQHIESLLDQWAVATLLK